MKGHGDGGLAGIAANVKKSNMLAPWLAFGMLSLVVYGAFSDGARGFEPRRYGFRPAEAAALDPQQRLLLDLTYGALVSRSPDRDALRGAAVGVCAGMMSIDAVLGVPAVDVGPHDLTGNGYAAAGSRLRRRALRPFPRAG